MCVSLGSKYGTRTVVRSVSDHIGHFSLTLVTLTHSHKHSRTPLYISITIIQVPNDHQQTVQRWWKDHFLGVIFPHPLPNQCVITTAIVILGNIIIIISIIILQC